MEFLKFVEKPMIEVLSITVLMGYLWEAIYNTEDNRKPSPNRQYSVFDATLGWACLEYSFSNAALFWSTKDN
jgi:hypothetical protein